MRLQFNREMIVILSVILMMGTMAGCMGTTPATKPETAEGHEWPTPTNPPPTMSSLQPGLTVKYLDLNPYEGSGPNKLRHLKKVPDAKTLDELGYSGKPITQLAHRADRGGHVFNSGLNRLVAAQMRGLIHFAQTGAYTLKAESNDGIRIFLDGQMIIDDPGMHGDRFSSPVTLDIREPGWYTVLVRYFQRKGTSALLLYWKKPGDSKFEIMPAEAYGHVPPSS